MNLAQSYEQTGQLDQAIAQYTLLKNYAGFTNQASLGLARMYMAKKDPNQARMIYQELLSSLENAPDPVLKSQVEARLAVLDADNTAILPQAEESTE